MVETPAAGAALSGTAPGGRERTALAISRAGAAAVLIGAFASPALANVGAAAMLIGIAVLPSAGQRLRAVLATPLARAALLLLAVFAVAMLWSEAAAKARFAAWWDWRVLLLLVIALAVFDEPAARRRALFAFIAAAVAGASYSFWAWGHGYSTVASHFGLPGMVLRNPVTQGMAFAVAGFFAVMLAATGRDLEPRWRVLLAVAALLLFVNLAFVTSGRSAHLVLLILLGWTAFQLLRGRQRVAAVAALPLMAVVAVGSSPMLQMRFGQMVGELRAAQASQELTSMGIRMVMWRISGDLVRERPLAGYGMGGIAPAYERAVKASALTGWAATPTEDPHNQYLQVQLEAGVAGSAAFLWFLFAAFRQRADQPWRTWASALLLGWCASSVMSSHFTTFSESHLLMVLLGLLLAPPRPSPH
jgi:O-antigen ligase